MLPRYDHIEAKVVLCQCQTTATLRSVFVTLWWGGSLSILKRRELDRMRCALLEGNLGRRRCDGMRRSSLERQKPLWGGKEVIWYIISPWDDNNIHEKVKLCMWVLKWDRESKNSAYILVHFFVPLVHFFVPLVTSSLGCRALVIG